ncbi:MAG: response regulator [Elusimicrobiota bacterium]
MSAQKKVKKILVAEDDPECRALLKDFLEERGYQVTLVEDGAKLYHLAPQLLPDLIISDLEMPGLSGGTAHALLRISDKTREIPVIFITGQTADRQARLVEFRPETPILRKPLNLQELGDAVADALETREN